MRFFPVVRWILVTQILAVTIITLFVLALWGWPDARSALFGGLTAFLPNLYFAVKFGVSEASRTAKEIVGIFYRGETIKLITTAVLFFLIFQLPEIRFLPLFASFGLVLTVFWFALLVRGTEV